MPYSLSLQPFFRNPWAERPPPSIRHKRVSEYYYTHATITHQNSITRMMIPGFRIKILWQEIGNLRFNWVKDHSGTQGNDASHVRWGWGGRALERQKEKLIHPEIEIKLTKKLFIPTLALWFTCKYERLWFLHYCFHREFGPTLKS